MAKAAATRLAIVQKAFDLIYERGYQATSIDEIIATTQVTKGAFFYHFKNKEEMGLAVINEIMYPNMIPLLGDSLKKPGDIRENIYGMMKALLSNHQFFKVEFGCPVVNLIEEMASLNANFHKALTRVIMAWQAELENAIRAAQDQQQLAKEHHAENIASYVISGYGGARYMGKVLGRSSYTSFLQEFKKYLNSL
ncbi:TetR/AcrR family transcriptional regulator [Mucilaginibacter dorajii]|uniref:TetR/AcrR family transcriptional regulator n=1 Tax=Mucilaginibacter dorajii TaxID=692994 RepID=A0ABP7R058_9SPHI|nr:TetR/AcrR family transcriptional regulator [Mucilaginibacter dorajii]MCS3732204.1 AcrR family transcriptional regulator [Mucilaginibacter dorajii]